MSSDKTSEPVEGDTTEADVSDVDVADSESNATELDTANVEALLPWLDYAFAAEKAALSKAAA